MLPLLSALLLLGGHPNTRVFYSPSTADLYVIGDAAGNAITMDDEAGYPRIRIGGHQTLNGVLGPTEFPIDRVFGRLIVSLGDGNDAVHFTTSIALHRIFHLGPGNDFLDMGGVGSERTEVYAGDGNDHVHAEDCSIGDLSVSLGSGTDDVEVAFSFVDRSFVAHGGAGDDVMRVRHTEFLAGPVRMAGGAGIDSMLDIESEFSEPPKLLGFENALQSASQVEAPANQCANPNALPISWPVVIRTPSLIAAISQWSSGAALPTKAAVDRRRRSDHAEGARARTPSPAEVASMGLEASRSDP